MQMDVGTSGQGGMMRREGVGKVKTLEIKTLWLQQKVKSKEVLLATEPTLTNKADLGTKILPGPRFEQMRLSNCGCGECGCGMVVVTWLVVVVTGLVVWSWYQGW